MDADTLASVIVHALDTAERAALADVADRIRAIEERLRSQRVYVAVLGQFKRGKSTLVNALLGEEVLPSSVVPLTAVPTVIRHGERRAAEVRFSDERPPEVIHAASAEELHRVVAQYVTEKANPENVLNVARVDVVHPAPVLEGGLVLVDTPGIGSTLRHNTQATINFLPECDAAIFVLSPDPPLTEVEREFLEQVLGRVERIFYVLTKIDYVGEDEREELLAFLQAQVPGADGRAAALLAVSGRQALEAPGPAADEMRRRSGIDAVETALRTFARDEMDAVFRAQVTQRVKAALKEMIDRLAFERQLLTMPLKDLDQRAEQFRTELDKAVVERRTAHDLIAGDRRRLGEELESEAERLRRSAREHLRELLAQEELDRFEEVLAEHIPPYFERALGEFSDGMSARLREALQRHQERADAIIGRVAELASDLFAVEYSAPSSAEAFDARREPYWVTHEWEVAPRALEQVAADKILPRALRERRLRRRSLEVVDRLVVNNVENVRWAVLQNTNDSLMRYAGDLDRRLAQVAEDIERAIADSMSRRSEGDAAVEERLRALERLEHEVEGLLGQLGEGTVVVAGDEA